ncbi:MAG TPA: folylpolyglutamate synthase/dihydrofolate synthase family protein [Candidatus Limnocylindria bacterium]|nr:folylpolyglutamate synthase/dihydrofolate synthase family protein [Candidatus Limnocylindria bacterium]
MASYSETLERIYKLHGGAIDLRLDRVAGALKLFDHPERKFPSIHIAGTNGKGSTSAMLQRILSLSGYRAALYTSPHLVSFTERIKIGDEEISQDEVVAIADEIWRRTAAVEITLTYFEVVTVMAFIYFARHPTDVAVIEVGLGGRFDATNVITPLVALITTISKDHEAFLGNDLLSIAGEKAGIIKPGVPVVCGAVNTAVGELFRQIANDRGSKAYFFGEDFKFSLKNEGYFDYTGLKQHYFNLSLRLRGEHQRHNAAVAIAALETVQDRLPSSEAAIRAGLATVQWPGRFEIMLERPTVVIDGAHNGEGVLSLVEELKVYRGRKIKLLFAVMSDKDWRLMLARLIKVVSQVTFTKVAMERSADPAELARHFAAQVASRSHADACAALRGLIDESAADDVIVVAGSLYLIGEIRPMLQEIAAARSRLPS